MYSHNEEYNTLGDLCTHCNNPLLFMPLLAFERSRRGLVGSVLAY